MNFENVLASVAVKDLRAAEAWYERVLGRAPDARPMPKLSEWRFPKGGWLQVYLGPERAGGGSATLMVDDLDTVLATLRELAIDTSEQVDGAAARTVMIKDPDGNSLAFAQPITLEKLSIGFRRDVAR